MANRHRRAAALVAACALATLLPAAALAQELLYLELDTTLKSPIPGACSNWNELWPNHGAPHHQDEYIDSDGDGELTQCDYIKLDGQWYHIEWAGPTYSLECPGTLPGYFEPTVPQTGGDPTCETWVEIFPNHGQPHHVDFWSDDNADGVVSACDWIVLGGRECHIRDIGVNLRVRPSTPVPNEGQSWGSLKSLY